MSRETIRHSNTIKTVSFIIPMYAGKKYIVECVSYIKKLRSPKEIIIVDDGSPDDSFQFCVNVFKDDEEIVLLTKDNGGIASARNFGLDIAEGKYVVFVDQDDIVVPEVIEKAIAKIDLTQSQIVFWNTEKLYETRQKKSNTHSDYEILLGRSDIVEKVIPNFLYKKRMNIKCELGPVWGAIFSRDLILNNEIRFKSFVNYEDDHLFLSDALSYANSVFFLPETGYYWRVRMESTSHKRNRIPDNYTEKCLKSNQYRIDRYREICDNKDEIEEYETYIKQRVIINSINNVCTFYSWSWSEIKTIRDLLYKDGFLLAFTNHDLIDKNNYTKTMYSLLRRKLYWIAIGISFINSIRLYIKDRIHI